MSNSNNSTKTNDEISTGHSASYLLSTGSGVSAIFLTQLLMVEAFDSLSTRSEVPVNSEHADSTLCYFWSEVISDRKQLRLKNILDTESLELLGGCSHDSTLDFEDTNSVTTEMAKKIKTNKNENEDVYYNLGEDDESEITQKFTKSYFPPMVEIFITNYISMKKLAVVTIVRANFKIFNLRVKKNTIGFRRDSIELAPSPQEQLNFLRQIKESTSNICKNCCSKINHNELINDDLSDD
ncbi:8510_t:CDS:2 [Entrophospora sp. SA101]|nr:8510_t:CDS:2 [Entrophospora sp. SA101]